VFGLSPGRRAKFEVYMVLSAPQSRLCLHQDGGDAHCARQRSERARF